MAHLALDLAVEGAADHVPLLLRRQTHKVNSITRDAYRELRVLVRVLHRVLERLPINHVEVHVEPTTIEVDVEGLDGLIQKLAFGQMRLLRCNRNSVADAVLGVLVGQLRNRQAGSKPAMAVAAMHRIGTRSERLTLPAPVRGVSGGLAVHNVGGNRQHALGVRRVAIGRMLADLPHEAGDDVRRDLIYAVIVVAELGCRFIPLVLVVDDQACRIASDADVSILDRAEAVDTTESPAIPNAMVRRMSRS